jgi:hypothetical protein
MSLLDIAHKYKNGAIAITSWLGAGGVPVAQAIAQNRANVCLKCPHNNDNFKPAEIVASAIRRVIEIKNDSKLRVDGEKSLKTCDICLCPLRTKIWTPIDIIQKGVTEEERAQFATVPGCWQNQ